MKRALSGISSVQRLGLTFPFPFFFLFGGGEARSALRKALFEQNTKALEKLP